MLWKIFWAAFGFIYVIDVFIHCALGFVKKEQEREEVGGTVPAQDYDSLKSSFRV